MWLWLLVLLGFYILYRWYQDRQVLENLTDKYVFITGCDSGFGNLLARQLDGRGLQVLAACLTQRGAEQLKEATSQRLQTIIVDVTDTESVSAAANWVKQQVRDQGLWGLVNNAGTGIPGAPNEWLTKDDFVKVLDVNLVGMIDVTLCLLPLIRKAKGRIVNVSSIVGRITFCGGGYCISKYGIEAFSDSLRRELNPFGVKVIILEPGFFKTELNNLQHMKTTLYNIWSQVPAAVQESYGQKYYEDYVKHTEKTFLTLCNSDLSPVSDCMEHALTAVHPHTRYSAGWDAKLFYIPLSYLPTVLADFLLTWPLPKPVEYR
ncbi:retinol dehydrogenase 16 [Microcaecilia unicolor]|uniref:Retinol dehydrogenase 16-like n=1 Tax=Microcaecilia unicolor TaxID=1415580 RepID=A0A6P7XL85_9AMPH|nr:retinol dehydrogenase 16-like [Microcaecilia unicolor]XP_030051088.1 retinol dehydrogenase 16-like [Microcaecilia unicolor]XP_030051089.1 retinol dehydrogenase 16-like [Microcaecilia unicolor]XP_030051090.1 retinol dehydrogenase 16-like [Microcaecilia unicolor]